MSPSKVSTIDYTSFSNIIDGKPRGSNQQHQGVNPVDGENLWDVPVASKQDVDDAVVSAQKAFKTWSQVPMEKRKKAVRDFKELYMSHAGELTDLLIKETGKPRMWAEYEVVPGVIGLFDHFLTLDLPEERIQDPEKTVTIRYTPLGVAGAIIPWNFPLILSIGKIIPALLTGNTIIVKPSEFTPYSLLKAVGGDGRVGAMLTAHPHIAKISFTGSIATGKKIAEAAAKTLKRVTLELGGNDASIVLPDVDIAKVAPQLVLGAFQNSGQVCVATKRIFIHQDIYAPMLKAMAEFAATLKVGDPNDKSTHLGPIQNIMQYEKVKGFYADVKKNNYKIAIGSADVVPGKGFFIQPTIIDNPPNGSRIIEEEPFGPIVPTQPWTDIEEVIERANSTETGLGACVWGADVQYAESIARRLEAGSVFVNSFEKIVPAAVFSGHKQSGLGGEWGSTALLQYCNAQAVHSYKL